MLSGGPAIQSWIDWRPFTALSAISPNPPVIDRARKKITRPSSTSRPRTTVAAASAAGAPRLRSRRAGGASTLASNSANSTGMTITHSRAITHQSRASPIPIRLSRTLHRAVKIKPSAIAALRPRGRGCVVLNLPSLIRAFARSALARPAGLHPADVRYPPVRFRSPVWMVSPVTPPGLVVDLDSRVQPSG